MISQLEPYNLQNNVDFRCVSMSFARNTPEINVVYSMLIMNNLLVSCVHSNCARDGTSLVLRPSTANCSSKEFETKNSCCKVYGKLSLDILEVHARHLAPQMQEHCWPHLMCLVATVQLGNVSSLRFHGTTVYRYKRKYRYTNDSSYLINCQFFFLSFFIQVLYNTSSVYKGEAT